MSRCILIHLILQSCFEMEILVLSNVLYFICFVLKCRSRTGRWWKCVQRISGKDWWLNSEEKRDWTMAGLQGIYPHVFFNFFLCGFQYRKCFNACLKYISLQSIRVCVVGNGYTCCPTRCSTPTTASSSTPGTTSTLYRLTRTLLSTR